MFVYEKKLQYPVKISTPNPKLAKAIITQYGGPKCSKTFVRCLHHFEVPINK